MALSAEDDLRLNVLLVNPIHAIRIDEGKMVLHALSDQGEAKLQLHPTGRPDQYLKTVRETISGHVLGSPGGYPLYIKRWTRMGQINSRLEDLLRLGEPEAITAVVHAPGLTNELARRAWWCMPEAENARRMLRNPDVAEGDMGVVLAEFLVEFLPFEEDPAKAMESVALVLQPGLIDDQTRDKLWKIGQRKNALRVGFLCATPDQLPETRPDCSRYASQIKAMVPLIETGNPAAQRLAQLLSEPGQSFLAVAEQIMKKPATQEVVSGLLNAISDYCSLDDDREQRELRRREIAEVLEDVDQLIRATEDQNDPIQALRQEHPEIEPALRAMLILARCNEALVTKVFAHSSAVGSVMRKQIKPLTDELFPLFATLRGK